MAAKTSWHRYGTKLRHCDPMYMPMTVATIFGGFDFQHGVFC